MKQRFTNFSKLKQSQHLRKRLMLLLFSIFLMSSMYAQERTVSGTVFDNSGISLPGVNVVIKGTATGVVTDLDGKFSIKVPNNQTVLEIRYVGYETQEINVGEQTNIKVTLAESVKEIDQVVVIGYGTQKKSDLTGAVASISAKDLKAVPMTRIDEAMEGRAAGVNVIAATGMPGGSRNIQIRGVSSINGYKPLIVVDGIATSDDGIMNRISPSDIESIEILKDAASAAIYGSSGGNGVIIINTKKGKAGKITVAINSYYSIQEVCRKLDLMNTRQWNTFYTAMTKRPYIFSEDSLNRNIDWQDQIYRKAPIKNIDVSITGGSDKSHFAIGANYLDQEGIVKNTGYNKLIFSISSQHELTKHIKIDEVVRFTNQKTDGPAEFQYQNVYNNFTTMRAISMLPFLQPYDENGKWTFSSDIGISNPMVGIDARSNQHIKDMNVDGNVGLNLEIIKGLVFTSRIGAASSINEFWGFLPVYNSWAKDKNVQSRLDQTWRRSYSYTYQNYITFDHTFMDVHNVTLMGGTEAADWGDYDINGYRLDFASTSKELLYFDNSSNSTEPQLIRGSGKEAKRVAYYGRVNYGFKSMILAQFNFRRDGMSNFGPNNRWGSFKSGSVGFKFTELEAIKNLNIFSFGKLRFGIGESGQFPITTYWPYASSILNTNVMNYAFNDKSYIMGLGPVQIPNPDLQWETVTTTNIGADLGFFKDQLNISVEYFIKKNDKMIMPKETPSLAGTGLYSSPGGVPELGGTGITSTFPYVNFGTVENKGFEFTLDYKKTLGDLKLNFGLNFTYQTNEITALAQDSTVQGGVHDITPITISKVGHSIGEFIGYRFNGLYKQGDARVYNKKAKRWVYADQPYTVSATGDTSYANNTALPGDAKWKNLNNDGIFSSADYDYLGSYIPPYVFGFNLGAEYKGIDFSVFFQGVYGNEIFNGMKRYLHTWENWGNHSTDVINRYHLPVVYDGVTVDPGNLTSNMPEIRSVNWQPPSDLYVEDGSYLRLRTLTLGYTLPKKLVNKIGLERLRFYFIGKNLFTLTNYTGYDPEISNSNPKLAGIDISGYPQTKQYTFGVNVDF